MPNIDAGYKCLYLKMVFLYVYFHYIITLSSHYLVFITINWLLLNFFATWIMPNTRDLMIYTHISANWLVTMRNKVPFKQDIPTLNCQIEQRSNWKYIQILWRKLTGYLSIQHSKELLFFYLFAFNIWEARISCSNDSMFFKLWSGL